MKIASTKSIALTIAWMTSGFAAAAAPTFQITEVFSNLDGTYQFIQLQETAGLNGQHHFAGLTLTSTRDGVTKTITFPADLPSDQTANQKVLIAVAPGVPYYTLLAAYGEINLFPPDFIMPVRFLPTDGGTLDFAGVDSISYPALPHDGWRGWFRGGTFGAVGFSGFQRHTPALADLNHPVAQEPVMAVEYYNAGLDHYFITASAADIDAIESGRMQGWTRSTTTFPVVGGELIYFAPSASDFPDGVCRFYIPPSEGDSHFYSASADECQKVAARFPEFTLESSAIFFVRLPDPSTGACPSLPYFGTPGRYGNGNPLRAVFRLWNHRVDSNHRYTTDPIVRAYLLQQGYVSEGYGPFGVAFCVFEW